MDTARQRRQGQNISLYPDEQSFARRQADQFHGGNISDYFRALIRMDRGQGLTASRVLAHVESQADERVEEAVPA